MYSMGVPMLSPSIWAVSLCPSSVPSLAQPFLSESRWAGAWVWAHPWVFHPVPLQPQPGLRHIRPGTGTMLRWPRCGSPAHAPAREGSERLHSHHHRTPSPPAPALCSLQLSSQLGGPPSPPRAQLEDTGAGIRTAGRSRLCAAICAAPTAGPRHVLGEQRGQAPI